MFSKVFWHSYSLKSLVYILIDLHGSLNPHTNMEKKLAFLNMRGPQVPRMLTGMMWKTFYQILERSELDHSEIPIITVFAAFKVLRGPCGARIFIWGLRLPSDVFIQNFSKIPMFIFHQFLIFPRTVSHRFGEKTFLDLMKSSSFPEDLSSPHKTLDVSTVI